MTYYKEHGIKPEAIEMPIRVDTFKINKMMHLKQVSELVGIPLEEVKNLNPQYTHDVVPGNSREYLLRLPYTYTNSFIANEDSLYTYKADQYLSPATLKKIVDGADGERIVYKVKSGDYLGRIASKYRCSVAQIKKWNGLKSNNLRIGQKLVIYRGGSSASSSSASTAKSATTTASASTASKSTSSTSTAAAAAPKAATSGEYTTYTIKSGDSFYSIAKNYPGVSAQDIMNFNGLSSSKIKPGMKIRIPKK
jgi:membrane-bound lytic murein transglycosylase D